MPTCMVSAMIARPLWNSCYLLARFSVYVSTLFGLKKTDNLHEFKYLYPNQTFFKFPQQNCSFIFSPFLLKCCKICQRIGNCYSRNLPSLASLPTVPYLPYLTFLPYLPYLPNLLKTPGTALRFPYKCSFYTLEFNNRPLSKLEKSPDIRPNILAVIESLRNWTCCQFWIYLSCWPIPPANFCIALACYQLSALLKSRSPRINGQCQEILIS